MEGKSFKYVIALEFFTNAGVKNEKCGQLLTPYEVIQCFSIIFDAESGEVVEEYERVIRPEKNPILSEACKELTGVTQIEVDDATEFCLFMVEYQQWLSLNGMDPYAPANRNYIFATFGDWNLRDILPKQCALQEIEIPLYFDEWIDIRRLYQIYTGITGPTPLQIVNKAKLPRPEQKRGLEDCRAIIAMVKDITVKRKLPLQITSVINSEGVLTEKEIIYNKVEEVKKKEKRAVGNKAKARGKYKAPTPPTFTLDNYVMLGKEIVAD